jgi:signal transduction histidine kinase/ActR/RegA family two-component response regulator
MTSSDKSDSSSTISLKYKFAVFTSVLILFVCVVLSLFLLDKVERELRRQIQLRGMSSITNFAENAKYSIMTENRVFLDGLVENEISKEGVVHIVVINERGIIVGNNNPSMVGKQIEDDYSLALLKDLTEPTFRQVKISTGETVYDFITPILDKDIYTEDRYADPYEAKSRLPNHRNLGLIRIGISFRKMEASMQETYRGVTYISLGIACLSIILAFWYGKILVRPLREMTRIASRLASGYLDERVDINNRDEIGLLAHSFNTMAKSLQESRSNLWKLNKELEYSVEERTADLKAAYQDLQQIDQLKSSFLSTVSHELRTPLTSILGFSRIIQKHFKRSIIPALAQNDPKATKACSTIQTNLEIISTESNRLARLINDVLDLAKIESGKMDWNIEEFNLFLLFEKAIHNLGSLIDHPGIQIELKGSENQAGLIPGDVDRILQIITNLLSNAIKFTPSGVITCKVERLDTYVQASVKDSGVGIQEHELVKVFEKFQQAGDTLTEKPQGTGLGLPICKEIVEYHAGHIWADSKPSRGSTFYFALPLDRQHPVPEGVKEVTFQLQSKLDKMSKSEILILIADEDPQIRNLLQGALETEGYRIIQAVNGKEAYDLAREYPVNAILIDVMMYEIDGFDTPHYLKADQTTCAIPIILLSVIMNRSAKMLLGASSYTTSPLTAEKILNRLAEHYRDKDLPLSKTMIYFFGFPRAIRKNYVTELKNMGIKIEHFDVFSSLLKTSEHSPPSMIVVDFKDTGISPNHFFRTFRNSSKLEDSAILAMVHETQIAKRIETAPTKSLSTVQDITDTINEFFKRKGTPKGDNKHE